MSDEQINLVPQPLRDRDLAARAFLICCGVIFAIALALRLVHLHQIRTIPLFSHLIGDAESYDQWAQQIASGQWLGREVFYQAPLYPYFLGVIYKVLGHALVGARIVQSVLGAASCVLLALAGREFFSRRTGVIAGLLLAIYPSAIFFDTLIQKSVLDLLFVCALLYLLGAAQNRPSIARWIGIGASLGALMLTRENAAVLLVVVIAWICIGRRAVGFRRRAQAVARVFATVAVILLPVAIRNQIVGGEFHLTTSQLGPNLYIGNNPSANGAYIPLVYGHSSPKEERTDATQLAESALGRKLSPGEVSGYWIAQVTKFIHEQPGAWMNLMRVKLILFWNATELGDTEDQYVYADWSRPLKSLNPLLTFGVLAAFATAGVGMTLRHWRNLAVLYALGLVYAASVIAFYVMARYRFPIVPVLILFSAAGVASLREMARGKEIIPTWQTVVALIAGAGVFVLTLPIPNEMVRATTYQNIARVLDDDGKLDQAFDYYWKSRALWPADPLVNILMGRIRLDQHKPAESLPYFEEAVRLAPEHAPAWVAWGAGLLATGDNAGAAEKFTHALQLDPQNERARAGLNQARAHQSPESRQPSDGDGRFGL